MSAFLARIPVRRPLAFAAVALLGVVFGGTTVRVTPTEASAPRQLIRSADAAALLDATTGTHLAEARAIGDEARLINASMPFSSAPVLAARPFDIPSSGGNDYRRALLCLTQAVYYEAGFEPMEGRRAVAQVVLNRLRHPAFPKSVCGVVYQGAREPVCQFSFVCDGSLYRRPALGAWKQAEAVAAAALNGFVEKQVGAATHYHADYVAPVWAPRLAKIAQIGAHIFYRWPGAWGSTAAFSGRYVGEPYDPASLRPPLRVAVAEEGTRGVDAPVSGPITDGTLIQRAPNDVGGLLDTSKGWTLSIPMPGEAAPARSIADKQKGAAPQPAVAEAAVGAQLAAR